MVNFILNGVEVSVSEGTTVLEAARFYGLEIPTLCHNDGLTPYGACRLCLVETGAGNRSRLVTSCTFLVTEALQVRTASARVVKTRRLLLEMYLATCPSSKVLQDLASRHHVTQVRFRPRQDDCILCGLCVRICDEQMQAKAVGFTGRGKERKITTFFRKKSRDCRLCGACMYICPACQARCHGPAEKSTLCGACLNLSPPCLEVFPDMMCYLEPCVACSPVPAKK